MTIRYESDFDLIWPISAKMSFLATLKVSWKLEHSKEKMSGGPLGSLSRLEFWDKKNPPKKLILGGVCGLRFMRIPLKGSVGLVRCSWDHLASILRTYRNLPCGNPYRR